MDIGHSVAMVTGANPPRQIADAAFAAVADGVEGVFPDPMSAEMHASLLQDAKAVERQAAEFG